MKSKLSPAFRRYLKQVEHSLNLPREMRSRIRADLESTIAARLENNMSEAEILSELGKPADIAAEFNAHMGNHHVRKSPLRFVCLGAAILSAMVLIGKVLIQFLVNDFINGMSRSIGIIGGADGPTAILISTTAAPLSPWLMALLLGAAAIVCLVLAVRVRKLERKLK